MSREGGKQVQLWVDEVRGRRAKVALESGCGYGGVYVESGITVYEDGAELRAYEVLRSRSRPLARDLLGWPTRKGAWACGLVDSQRHGSTRNFVSRSCTSKKIHSCTEYSRRYCLPSKWVVSM